MYDEGVTKGAESAPSMFALAMLENRPQEASENDCYSYGSHYPEVWPEVSSKYLSNDDVMNRGHDVIIRSHDVISPSEPGYKANMSQSLVEMEPYNGLLSAAAGYKDSPDIKDKDRSDANITDVLISLKHGGPVYNPQQSLLSPTMTSLSLASNRSYSQMAQFSRGLGQQIADPPQSFVNPECLGSSALPTDHQVMLSDYSPGRHCAQNARLQSMSFNVSMSMNVGVSPSAGGQSCAYPDSCLWETSITPYAQQQEGSTSGSNGINQDVAYNYPASYGMGNYPNYGAAPCQQAPVHAPCSFHEPLGPRLPTKHVLYDNALDPYAAKLHSLGPLSLRRGNRLLSARGAASFDGVSKLNLCRICGKTYARPSTLKTHMRTHSGEKPYRCTICDKSFSQAANLTAHVRTHSGEKPFRCVICERRFSQSSSVTTHMRTHSGERPYRCRMCKKAFSDSSTLTKHLRIHSGEKPYQCKVCLLRFSQSGNLNRHMRVHSTNS